MGHLGISDRLLSELCRRRGNGGICERRYLARSIARAKRLNVRLIDRPRASAKTHCSVLKFYCFMFKTNERFGGLEN
jgi:hypothetical protein